MSAAVDQEQRQQQQQQRREQPKPAPEESAAAADGNTGDGRRVVVDLCREGAIDRCAEMLAEKIIDPAFWANAEQFVAQEAPVCGHEGVREVLAQHIGHLFGVNVRGEQLVLVPNEYAALDVFAAACCSPGDVLLCPAPFADPELARVLGTSGRLQLQPVQLVRLLGTHQHSRKGPLPFQEDATELSIVDLEEAVVRLGSEGKRVRALLLHNPHPILSWIGDGQRRLAHILEWATARDLFLVVDESLAAMDLWEFSSCLGLDNRGQLGQHLVWIWSGAKHLSLPGLELAALILPNPEQLSPVLPLLQLSPCAPLVQYLAAKLLEDHDWTSELFARRKSRLEELRRMTIEGLVGMELMRTLVASEAATPWILADLRMFLPGTQSFDSERTLRREFEEEAGLLLSSGEHLGMAEAGWFRIRVAGSEERVKDVLDRLNKVLAGRKASATEWADAMDTSMYGGMALTELKRAAEWMPRDQRTEEEVGEEHQDEVQEQTDAPQWHDGEGIGEVGEWRNGGEEPEEEGHAPVVRSAVVRVWKDDESGERRISVEQDEDEQLLRQVFPGAERQQPQMDVYEGGDQVLEQVFAVFPSERLHWREPLVDEESLEEARRRKETARERERQRREEEEEQLRRDQRRREEEETPKQETAAVPVLVSRLADLSFIEQLVKESSGEPGGPVVWAGTERAVLVEEGEFYDEASTEEEEEQQNVEALEAEEPERDVRIAQHYQPLTIEVPILVGSDGLERSKRAALEARQEEEEESKRIINIIDQIFHEAVEIREYSDMPSGEQTALSPRHEQQHQQLWSRSDSGLAGESSPPDYSMSPFPEVGQHPLYSIDERSPDFADEAILFRDNATFGESPPIQTSTLLRRAHWMDNEEEAQPQRLKGPSAQMLDDSGIFVDMPPGSLSIDFPLLVPAEQLREQALHSSGMAEAEEEEEELAGGVSSARTGGTVAATSVAMFTEDELHALISEGQQQQAQLEATLVRVGEESVETKAQELGWTPLENVELRPEEMASRAAVRTFQVGEAGEEEEATGHEEYTQSELAAMLSEGSAFCPSPSPQRKEFEEQQLGEQQTPRDDGRDEGVATWIPLDQLEEAEMEQQRRGSVNVVVVEDTTPRLGKKFSEELDELEQEEKSTRLAQSTAAVQQQRRRSVEAMDVVADWNARVAGQKPDATLADEAVDVDLRFRREEWEAGKAQSAEVHLADREQQQQQGGAVRLEAVEGMEESGQLVRTVVNISPPEKPPRTGLRRAESEEQERDEEGKETSGDGKDQQKRPELGEQSEHPEHMDIPGRSRTYQVHQRMQMGRRTWRHRPDSVVLEHMNITEVDYLGGQRTARKGSRAQRTISTQINRWAPSEWFGRLPLKENLARPDDIEWRPRRGEVLRKYVEVGRSSRAHTMPSTSAGERIREESTREYMLIRKVEDDDEKAATQPDEGRKEHSEQEEKEELCCRLRLDSSGRKQPETAAEYEYLVCKNPDHTARSCHCDPNRLYTIRRSTMMSENAYKKMKREREGHPFDGEGNQQELLESEFETVHSEWTEPTGETVVTTDKTRSRHRHRLRRANNHSRRHSPTRITVTTVHGADTQGAESIDRVTVRHTPGSRWIVSSVYKSTEYGWEKTSLRD